jgi:hypothetical protein
MKEAPDHWKFVQDIHGSKGAKWAKAGKMA